MDTNKIGLLLIFNDVAKQEIKTFSSDSLDKVYQEMVDYLAEQFNKRIIDFPLDYDELAQAFYDEERVNDVFTYYLFTTDWKQPWTLHDIYDSVLDAMSKLQEPCSDEEEKEIIETNETNKTNDSNQEEKLFREIAEKVEQEDIII